MNFLPNAVMRTGDFFTGFTMCEKNAIMLLKGRR